ncbi:MAG TPA: BTAD domain-containing putative transcriptional regulator [Pseudonocardiaceae bacterium]
MVGRLLQGLIAAVVLAALVVGLPWALVHYVGWPLPHHVPTWPDLQAFLLTPMSVTFLLDFLACACWIVWFFFTLDVLRCTVEVVRGARWPDLSGAGPMHTLAGVLVGAVLLSVLGNRPAPTPNGPLSGALGTGSPVVATALAWQNTAPPSTFTVRQAVFTTPAADSAITDASTPAASHPVSVIVRAPENGVYDSLWRIAQRTLGDGARWPEIFHVNEGKPQPGGRTFTQPSLIYPGQELDLPATAAPPPAAPPVTTPPPAPTPTTPPPATSPPTTTPPPASSLPATPAPSTHHAPTTGTGSPPSTREPGFRWEPDLFVGLGLAAAVSAALLIARRRYRARYQPGSGDRDDFPVTPVVYQLRLAHLRAEQDDEIDLDDDLDGAPSPRGVIPPARVIGTPNSGSVEDPALAPRLGVRDGREIALNLAVARGLGLVGAGGPAAARALLVTALSASNDQGAGSAGARVVVPAEDLVPLLRRGAAHTRLPAALRVADSLEAALDALEAEILVRAGARTGTTSEDEPRSWPTLVLAATVPEHQRPRLQAVLDNGSPFGITGLLLGQWQPGVTAYIRADGTVSASSPGLGEQLRGTHMFHLGDEGTAELLTLLAQAEPDPPPRDGQGDDGTPTVGPRIVPVRPDDNHAPGKTAGRGLDGADHGPADPVSDTELEVTAAAQPPVTADGELEILASSRPAAPGARLRPPAAARPRPAADGEPLPGEVEDTPAPPHEHSATAATPTPTPATGIAQHDADTARALITISVLGALRVHWHPEAGQEREITGALQPRTQELLVLLALHPGGTTRDTLVSVLWGEDPPTRPTNALHTALARMRRDLGEATGGAVTDIALVDNGHYRLDPAVVHVDYWRFENAMLARRAAATDAQRIAAYREVVDSYGGPLAEGMSKIEWSEPAREAIRRDAIDAVSGLARALHDHDPQQTLDLLEVARAFDPHNELLYRDIMRLQERLGLIDAIPRTLTLLTTRLAEVNNRPSEHAIGLATRLRQRHDDNPSARSRAETRWRT